MCVCVCARARQCIKLCVCQCQCRGVCARALVRYVCQYVRATYRVRVCVIECARQCMCVGVVTVIEESELRGESRPNPVCVLTWKSPIRSKNLITGATAVTGSVPASRPRGLGAMHASSSPTSSESVWSRDCYESQSSHPLRHNDSQSPDSAIDTA